MFTAETEKILKYVFMNDGFKTPAEIERNSRVYVEVKRLQRIGILTKNEEGLYVFNLKKYPQLQAGEKYMDRYKLEGDEKQKVKERLKLSKELQKKTPRAVTKYYAKIIDEFLK